MRNFENFLDTITKEKDILLGPVYDMEAEETQEPFRIIFYALYDFYTGHPSLRIRAENPEFKIYRDYLFYRAWSSFLIDGPACKEYDLQALWKNLTGTCGGTKPSSPSWNQAIFQLVGLVAVYMEEDDSP